MNTEARVVEYGSLAEEEVSPAAGVNQLGCCKGGPGYATPIGAMSGPRESLIYVTCIYTGTRKEKPDYLATVDVDPNSQTYSKVIHRLPVPHVGDELHDFGWNACSSCYGDPLAARRYLVLPSLISGRIYAIDTQKNPKAPTLHKVVEPADIIQKTGLAYPHTAHCLASGDIMFSCLGDKDGKAEGSGFLLLDSEFNVKGRWEKPGHSPLFGSDFWYQPRHKTMISSSWGAPETFTKGFNLQHVLDGLYGHHLHVYSWPDGELKQTLDLGNMGHLPLAIRFLHDPSKDIGFVGCALSSNMVRFFKTRDGSWSHEVAISVKPLKVLNWVLPEMPGLITDFLMSLDDHYLYLVNWLHGDIRQYNIKDPKNPVLIGQVWVGGLFQQIRALPKFMVWLILFVSVTYVVYTLKLVTSSSRGCDDDPLFTTTHNRLTLHQSSPKPTTLASESLLTFQNRTENIAQPVGVKETQQRTELKHIVFGIAGSAKLWDQRKNYIKLWWKPNEMRGVAWLDSPVKTRPDEGLPQVRISGDTSRLPYSNRQGHRSAIRISRIVSETFRLGMENVSWFVMGDDDTVFVTDNLVRVLSKYDHNQYYYIGSLSESHLQNIYFSYSMAYGGGGFAISYPLAKALEKMQDRCIKRYPGLFASDDRMQACMAELGVPLTKELGFHQYDVYGNLFGLLAAHPVAPFVSLHHLDVVEPIFPNVTRVEALQRLKIPMQLDSAGLMQQSICYDRAKKWTVSVSWGFAVQVFRGILSPREIEMPSRTFLNWYRRADYTAYAFNTRPVSRNPCQKPFVFYLSRARLDSSTNQTVSEYSRHHVPHPACRWKMPDPADIDRVEVYKKQDPHLWERSPRRNCCRIINSKRRNLVVDVRVCSEGEISEV